MRSELQELKGLKFSKTLQITFEKKLQENKTTYKTAYFSCRTKTLTNHGDIPEAVVMSQVQILQRIGKWISEGSGWTVDKVNNHFVNTVKYEPLRGSPYIKLRQSCDITTRA